MILPAKGELILYSNGGDLTLERTQSATCGPSAAAKRQIPACLDSCMLGAVVLQLPSLRLRGTHLLEYSFE